MLERNLVISYEVSHIHSNFTSQKESAHKTTRVKNSPPVRILRVKMWKTFKCPLARAWETKWQILTMEPSRQRTQAAPQGQKHMKETRELHEE